MNTQVKDVGLVVFGILMFISVFMSLQKVETYLKYKAMDDCAKIARYEAAVENGGRVSYPLDDVYKACLKDKGVK